MDDPGGEAGAEEHLLRHNGVVRRGGEVLQVPGLLQLVLHGEGRRGRDGEEAAPESFLMSLCPGLKRKTGLMSCLLPFSMAVHRA